MKTNLKNAGLFILGVIVTIIITKVSEKFVPSDPILVRQITDTIKLVHDYNIPKGLEEDTIRQNITVKLRNLELLNNYDRQIKDRIKATRNSDELTPNLLLTKNVNANVQSGYTYGSTSAYYATECPNLGGKYLDFSFNFFNSSIISSIAFLRVNIYKFESNESETASIYISEDFYQVKNDNNLIRRSNDLSTGKYEIFYGFMLKDDLANKFPKFYFTRCIVIKK